MTLGRRILGPALAVGLALTGFGTLGAASPDHAYVRITDGSVEPETLTVERGRSIGWINRSARIARISFDRDVARHLVCETGQSFQLTGERLVSQKIQALQFASLCQLAPGTYRYQVELASGIGNGGGLWRVLEGSLVVQ